MVDPYLRFECGGTAAAVATNNANAFEFDTCCESVWWVMLHKFNRKENARDMNDKLMVCVAFYILRKEAVKINYKKDELPTPSLSRRLSQGLNTFSMDLDSRSFRQRTPVVSMYLVA